MNQDWEPVKIRPKTGSRKADVNAAVRSGGTVVTEKKRTLGWAWRPTFWVREGVVGRGSAAVASCVRARRGVTLACDV